MRIKFVLIFLLVFTFAFCSTDNSAIAEKLRGEIQMQARILPAPATNFESTPGYQPGHGKCEFCWNMSITPNINTQELTLDDGYSFIIENLPFPNPPGPGEYYCTVVDNLIIGQTYYASLIEIVSEEYQSDPVATYCIPASDLNAPRIYNDPVVTTVIDNTNFTV